ncbi:hypothetical protein APHAL10511_002986 [Amanita phalloides]|nr:hypothetical protein APHAL10511_002986 [Amanita phalloides]
MSALSVRRDAFELSPTESRMAIFDGVIFHLPSSLPAERRAELKYVLVQNGAKNARSIHVATHIITNTNKFEGCQDVGGQVAVVTDMWVERSVILEKMQSPSHYSTDPAMIFSGVVACATELPETDVEVLSAGITALGGQWRIALTRDVTHLFCMSDASPKYETAMRFKEQTQTHVILPHWFDDCVRLGTRHISVESFEWPDPLCLRRNPGPGEEGADQASHKMSPQKKKNLRYSGWASDEPLPVADPSNIWDGRRILLSLSLELPTSRRTAIQAGIARCGGIIVPYLANDGEGSKEEEVENVGKSDVLVTKWRSGRAYVKAVREGKTIGTLGWVFCVHATGVISRPMDQLLHYPIPRRSIEGFSSHEITVTNYTGEAREYLKKLITAMGATFTPSMSGKNTVLIAAYISGTKTTKAAAWSIPIVNHTWLEDCFVKWRNLTVGVEKYIIFPRGIDFAKMLGERGVGGGFSVAGAADTDAVGNEDGIGVGGWVGLESEEELDALEREDDQFDLAEMDDEGSVGGEVDRPLVIGETSSPTKKSNDTEAGKVDVIRLVSPITQASASEVEAIMNLVQNEDDDDGDVEVADVPPRSKQKGKEKVQKRRGGSSSHKAGRARNGSDEEMEHNITEVEKAKISIRNKDAKSEGPKRNVTKYIAEAVEIVIPRRKKGRGEKDEEDTRYSRPDKGKANELSPKKEAMNKGKSKAIVFEDEEDESGRHLESKAVADTRGTGNSKAKNGGGSSDDMGNVVKIIKGKSLKNPAKSDETEEDDDYIIQKLRSERKKVVDRSGKAKEARKDEEEESDEENVPTKSKWSAKKTEMGRTLDQRTRTGASAKGKKTIKEDEGKSDEESENDSRTKKTSHTTSNKNRRKSAIDEDKGVTPRGKSRAVSKPVQQSSPLSSPKSPEPSSAVRPSKRSAALKASQILHDEIMPDMNNYQCGLRKGRISLGHAQEKLLKAAERSTPGNTRKRRGIEVDDDGDEQEPEIKKRKTLSNHTTIDSRKATEDPKEKVKKNGAVVLLTTQISLSDDITKALVKLGVKLTTHATECTHLIAPKIVRTEKFLCAIPHGPFIISQDWATRSAAAKKLLPEKSYLLRDEAGEEKFSFKLKDAIERAKRGKMFADRTFYVTPKVPTELQLLKNVITACGGQFSATTPTVRILTASTNRHVISCTEDISIWRPIASHYPIYNHELILTGALKQTAEWDNTSFRVPGSF